MTRAVSALYAVVLLALVWVLLHLAWYPHDQLVDYPVYRSYGDSIVHAHQVPYRDFRLEYPPGALPMFMIPAYLEHFDFRKVFQGLVFLCDVALVLAVLSVAGRRAAAYAAVAPLLLGSVVLSRFDMYPAALAAIALVLLVRGSRAGSAVFLASAFAAKLWPAALAPLIFVFVWRRDGRRRALEWAAATLATAAAWFVPFVVMAPGGVGHSFYRQFARPLQVESLGAALLVEAYRAVGKSATVVSTFGSQNLYGQGPHVVAMLTMVVELVALVTVFVLFVRGEPTSERLLLSSAAVVTALIAFGKVFSPQFLIWLIPLVPLVGELVPLGLFALALVLTQAYFPKRYWDYSNRLRPAESAIVLARDLVVVALFAALAYGLHRATASSSASASAPVSGRSGARTSG